MFKSKEIRWFTENPNQHIIKWFDRLGRRFDNTESRDDYYLPLDQADKSVKLREGNIEVKHRFGERTRGKLTSHTEGIFENWIKWSFKVHEEDKLSKEIIQIGKYDWIKTTKTRVGVKIAKGKPGKDEILDLTKFIDYGCQIEYTKILVNQAIYYSFGLEWIGEKIIEPDSGFLNEILGKSTFKPEQSMGYGQFLLNK